MHIDNQDLSSLPSDLATAAIVVGGEPVWRPNDAIRVVNYLADHGISIGVVEAWRDGPKVPFFVATCDFDAEGVLTRDGMTWNEEVEFGRRGALAFVEEMRHREAFVFNLHWVNQDDPPAP